MVSLICALGVLIPCSAQWRDTGTVRNDDGLRIKMISRVDFSDQKNLMIVAISTGMGLGVTVIPEMFAIVPESLQVVAESGIVMGV